jgi:hypothetical protein
MNVIYIFLPRLKVLRDEKPFDVEKEEQMRLNGVNPHGLAELEHLAKKSETVLE